MPLKSIVESNALCAEDQFMQPLAMCGLDFDPRTNIRRNEGIIKNSNIRERLRPSAILKHGLTACVTNNDMRRMLGAKSLALRNQDWIINCQ